MAAHDVVEVEAVVAGQDEVELASDAVEVAGHDEVELANDAAEHVAA